MRALDARGHVTFGGRLSEDAHGWLGLVAHRMAEAGHRGDFRSPARVRAWAGGIAADVKACPCRAPDPAAGGSRRAPAMIRAEGPG
jgi:menaquinone-dependent protoporphyrinogen oxidase